MKKFLLSIFILAIISIQYANAAIVDLSSEGEYQEYINKTGFKILNCNEIENHIIFKYSKSESIKELPNFDDMSVIIPKGVLPYIESEDELAAIIAHNIAYCLIYRENKFANIDIKIAPQKYKKFADKIAVDMLVKSGYSPIAIITMINKLYGDKKNKIFPKDMTTSIRLAEIYEYIVRKYPKKLQETPFCKNIYYQNFLLTSRNNRELLQKQLLKNPSETKKQEYR
ncbi:hypothetical protein IJG14_08825 [bacterium]|nr:hypothetical protein [bacterium]